MEEIPRDLHDYILEIEISEHALKKRFVQRWPGPAPKDRETHIKNLVNTALFHRRGKQNSLVYWSRDLNWKLYLNISFKKDICHVLVISCAWNGEKKNKPKFRDIRARLKREFKKETLNI